jgi:yeast amino acid transporter
MCRLRAHGSCEFCRFCSSLLLPEVLAKLSGWKVFLKDQWETGTFITNYLPVACYPILFVGCKLWRKTRFVRASEMDLISGVEEVEKDW